MMKELREAIISAEKTLGIHITGDVAAEVLMYSIRKCQVIEKDASYLPLLFENELLDYYMRAAINVVSEMNSMAAGGVL